MKDKIKKAIQETLVIDNKQSIHLAVDKILKIIDDDQRGKNKMDNKTA